ncbi:fungal-specific transcription factor domain-containing protein [Tricharina praecox]|uniref:fungal-specific transcription factor domain-containing protein n=1 Tax=Tricharina praecox TaxID=43433 RepID=UPI0022209036|nr:fungal-specific transcription factor domain-containing protein [Tricharina praecox]KAI5853454.1 fungal-specific transcription factor domain-containing protein [Tricharina praecox]
MLVNGSGWQQHIPPHIPTTPASAGSNTSSVPTKIDGLPQQKRRRVTRACDECRRKKIKCDGKQPCTHCTVYSYECTYDQPSNRRRNPAPVYLEGLENQVQRLKQLLKIFAPHLDPDNQELDISKVPTGSQAPAAKPQDSKGIFPGVNSVGLSAAAAAAVDRDSRLDSMVEATGRLDIDEGHKVEFHGHSSGMTYLNQLNSQFGGILGEVRLNATTWPMPKPPKLLAQDSPHSSSYSPPENISDVTLLPPKETAASLVETCLDKACVLMRFIHRPSFVSMMHRLYSKRPEDYDDDENTFLPLFYLVLAVGCLFVVDDDAAEGCEVGAGDALKYFNAGRRMIEMTDIRDIYSIQAVLLMAIYLQSSTRMSTCYSYVGIALCAAVKMGMHRAVPDARFNPIEREVRKRIFWTCWKMDTYVGAILGLPKGIAPEDIDQEMPAEVDDENITQDGIAPMKDGETSTMAAANAHIRLLTIMAKTVKCIYPLKGVEASVAGNNRGYSVSQMQLHEIELELAAWLESVPAILKPGDNTPREFLQCQYLLKMSFAHVQMMLYRPFVHYISRSEERPFAIAAACVKVSRNIVNTAEEMRRNGLLNGAYWFTIYTTFFAIITLIYYVLVNPPDKMSREILKDIITGRDCLVSIQEKSAAAHRCINTLNVGPRIHSTPNLGVGVLTGLQPLFEKAFERISNAPPLAPAPAELVPPKKKRARALSGATDAEGEDGESPSFHGHSSPGTVSPTESPVHRVIATPISPTEASKRLSTPPNVFGTKFTVSPDPQPPTTSMGFQTTMAGSGMPDLTSMMFPTNDLFSFVPHNMVPAVQQHTTKDEQTNQINSPVYPTAPNGNQFGSLEGNILGPLPPYLLQGQQPLMGDYLGSGTQSQGQRMDGNGIDTSMSGQFFMSNGGGGDTMVPDFFRDDWDDTLMQHSFRST